MPTQAPIVWGLLHDLAPEHSHRPIATAIQVRDVGVLHHRSLLRPVPPHAPLALLVNSLALVGATVAQELLKPTKEVADKRQMGIKQAGVQSPRISWSSSSIFRFADHR